MGYVNTGYARKKTLTITKGSTVTSYNITDAFTYGGTTYALLTDTQFAQLSNADYESRRTAFIAYVASLNSGLTTDCPDLTVGSVEYNTTACPISAQHEEPSA